MYYCRANSIETDLPIYQKLEGTKDDYFLVEARVAKHHVRTGIHEQPIIDWIIQNFVQPNKVCLDIGAHMGVYALQMARKAQHVYAFECSPQSFNFFCANIALQGLSYSIDKHNVALSNKEGTTRYYIRDKLDGGCNGIVHFHKDEIDGTPFVEVPTKTLDSFNIQNIGFIKIDVEGHEKEVLEGAVQTLRNNNYPPFTFESWIPNDDDEHNVPRTRLRRELFSFIESLGYKIHPVSGWPEQFLAVYR